MIEIGMIVKPQGVKGEVKIIPVDKAERYVNLKSVFVDREEKEVESIVARMGDLYAKFAGVKDRNDAEILRGKKVFAKKDELGALDQNEFYFSDLIGAIVVDEEGVKIGELIDIEQYGAADVISIRERNLIYSVPFIDSIFVDISTKKVVVSRREYDNNKVN